MNRRLALLSLVLVAAVAALVFNVRRTADPYAAIVEAEQIPDELQRCLAYPDLPDSRWPHDAIEALCRDLSQHVLGVGEIKTLLDSDRANELEAIFDSYLDDHFGRMDRRGVLTRALTVPFNRAAIEVEGVVARWREVAPKSAYAQTAAGVFLVAKAQAVRGDGASDETSEQAFGQMHELLAEAKIALHRAIELNPRVVPAYGALMSAARMDGDREIAIENGRHALSIDPANRDIYYRLMRVDSPSWGGSFSEMKALATSAQEHAAEEPALQLLASHVEAYPGAVQFLSHNYRAAAVVFKEAFAHAPDPEYLVLAGQAATQLGDYPTAIQYHTQAFRFGPHNVMNLISRAYATSMTGRNQWALQDIQRALDLDPRNAEVHYQQGGIFRRAGNLDRAETAFIEALREDDDHQAALLDLCNMYVTELKQTEKARPWVERLVKHYPRNGRSWLLRYEVIKDSDEAESIVALRKFSELADQKDPVQRAEAVRVNAYLRQRDRDDPSAPGAKH